MKNSKELLIIAVGFITIFAFCILVVFTDLFSATQEQKNNTLGAGIVAAFVGGFLFWLANKTDKKSSTPQPDVVPDKSDPHEIDPETAKRLEVFMDVYTKAQHPALSGLEIIRMLSGGLENAGVRYEMDRMMITALLLDPNSITRKVAIDFIKGYSDFPLELVEEET